MATARTTVMTSVAFVPKPDGSAARRNRRFCAKGTGRFRLTDGSQVSVGGRYCRKNIVREKSLPAPCSSKWPIRLRRRHQ
jgi:hypothetical protein